MASNEVRIQVGSTFSVVPISSDIPNTCMDVSLRVKEMINSREKFFIIFGLCDIDFFSPFGTFQGPFERGYHLFHLRPGNSIAEFQKTMPAGLDIVEIDAESHQRLSTLQLKSSQKFYRVVFTMESTLSNQVDSFKKLMTSIHPHCKSVNGPFYNEDLPFVLIKTNDDTKLLSHVKSFMCLQTIPEAQYNHFLTYPLIPDIPPAPKVVEPMWKAAVCLQGINPDYSSKHFQNFIQYLELMYKDTGVPYDYTGPITDATNGDYLLVCTPEKHKAMMIACILSSSYRFLNVIPTDVQDLKIPPQHFPPLKWSIETGLIITVWGNDSIVSLLKYIKDELHFEKLTLGMTNCFVNGPGRDYISKYHWYLRIGMQFGGTSHYDQFSLCDLLPKICKAVYCKKLNDCVIIIESQKPE